MLLFFGTKFESRSPVRSNTYQHSLTMMTSGLVVVMVSVVISVLLQGGMAAAQYSSHSGPVIPILSDVRDQDDYGGYNFQYSTGNGIHRHEAGRQNNGQTSEGGWRFVSPEGVPVEIQFQADQGGFRAYGAAIPTAPPLPYARN